TSQRRESAGNDRISANATENPSAVRATPATMRPSAISRGPAAAPAPTSTTASGTGPSRSDIGTRSGNRTSSPYAMELPAACAMGADIANTLATTLDETASAADVALVLATDASVRITAAGATTRIAVRPHGRGAS